MTKLKYNLNEAIILEIDISKLDSEILFIWWKAFNTECKIRSRSMSQSTNKTILHMSGVYVCLGLWPFEEVKRWWKELELERGKRMYIKHEKLFDVIRDGETEEDQIRRLETEYCTDKKRREQILNNIIVQDITDNNSNCGMIYQTGTSSHGTLNSPYTPSDPGQLKLSYLSLAESRDKYETETVDSVSITDSLSSLEDVEDVQIPSTINNSYTQRPSLLRQVSNFKLADTITSNLSDSMKGFSKSTANILRQCERYLNEGVYETSNGELIYNSKYPSYLYDK